MHVVQCLSQAQTQCVSVSPPCTSDISVLAFTDVLTVLSVSPRSASRSHRLCHCCTVYPIPVCVSLCSCSVSRCALTVSRCALQNQRFGYSHAAGCGAVGAVCVRHVSNTPLELLRAAWLRCFSGRQFETLVSGGSAQPLYLTVLSLSCLYYVSDT